MSGNALAANSSIAITTQNLAFTDVGLPGADPAYPSYVWSEGGGGYIVSAEGSDIWGTADAFNFGWELKTNDFDVVVRGVSEGHSSQCAKMGLMVRETLDTGSRNWKMVNTPAASDGIMAPDNSGFGANSVSAEMRDTANGASAGWGTGSSPVPAYPNAWLRLKRTGGLLSGFYSTDGMHWVQMASYNTATNANGALSSIAYVGLCTTAHNNDPNPGPPPPPFLYYNTAEYANYTSSYVPDSNCPSATPAAT